MSASGNTPSSLPEAPSSPASPSERAIRADGVSGERHRHLDVAGTEAHTGQDRGREQAFEVLVEHRPVDAREDASGAVGFAGVGRGGVTHEAGQGRRLGALPADVADDQPAALAVGDDVVEVAAYLAAGAHRAEVAGQLEAGDRGQGGGHQAAPQGAGHLGALGVQASVVVGQRGAAR